MVYSGTGELWTRYVFGYPCDGTFRGQCSLVCEVEQYSGDKRMEHGQFVHSSDSEHPVCANVDIAKRDDHHGNADVYVECYGDGDVLPNPGI